MGPEAGRGRLESVDALWLPHPPPKQAIRPGGRQMLDVALALSIIVLAALWWWPYDDHKAPYEDPDDWGSQ